MSTISTKQDMQEHVSMGEHYGLCRKPLMLLAKAVGFRNIYRI